MESDDLEFIEKIRKAIRGGNQFTADIARVVDETVQDVYNQLRVMVAGGELETFKLGGVTAYRFRVHTNESKLTPELETGILEAIRRNHRTYPGIQRFLCLEKSISISDALDRMQRLKLIKKHTNTEISAFFLFSEFPKDFWLKPDGTVDVIFKEVVERKKSGIKQAEPMEEKIVIKPSESVVEKRETETSKNQAPTKKGKGSTGIEWTPQYLTELAAKYYSFKAAGRAIGVSYTAINYQASKTPTNKTAWEEGQQEFLKNNPKPRGGRQKEKAAKADVIVPKTCAECGTEFTIENFIETEGGDFCNESCRKSFEKMNTDQNENTDQNFPAAETSSGVAANGNGKVHVEPRFENTLDHLSEKSDASRTGIERVKTQVAAQAAFEVIPPPNREGFNHFAGVVEPGETLPKAQSIGQIPFASGGGIVVGFDGNYFSMSKKEREILSRMADLMDEYKGEK